MDNPGLDTVCIAYLTASNLRTFSIDDPELDNVCNYLTASKFRICTANDPETDSVCSLFDS